MTHNCASDPIQFRAPFVAENNQNVDCFCWVEFTARPTNNQPVSAVDKYDTVVIGRQTLVFKTSSSIDLAHCELGSLVVKTVASE